MTQIDPKLILITLLVELGVAAAVSSSLAPLVQEPVANAAPEHAGKTLCW